MQQTEFLKRNVYLLMPLALLFIAIASDAIADDAIRVQDGLSVLYTFQDGSGDTVKDRSLSGLGIDLKIANPSAVHWGDNSLSIDAKTKLQSGESTKALVERLKQSGAITIEAWVTPKNVSQKGPARIVSLSLDSGQRNFTLGQEGERYQIRLRTSSTSQNGIPDVDGGKGTATARLTHIVYTRERDGKVCVYVNGKQKETKQVRGDFSNWDLNFPLVLANERTNDRPWLGEFHLVAIYHRALGEKEVTQNFQAGNHAGIDPRAKERMAALRREHVFATQIAPLLARHCLECHDSAIKKGGLDLSHKNAAFAGGESGKVIVPGKAKQSLLWEQIESGDMPPQGKPLSAEDQTLMREWINSGAVWSVETLDPAVYAVGPGATETWVQRLTIPEYIETVRSTVNVDISEEAHELLPPDLRADGFSNTAYNLNIDLKHVEAYAQLSQKIVQRMDLAAFAARFSKSRSLNTDATARKFVESVGEWLLRGPLESREVTNYSGILTAVASAGGDFDQGVGLMVEAMLQSPRFLYRIEQQHGIGQRRVGDYELASRLSYIIWGGPPDAELLKQASEGRLSNPDNCRRQVERMLKDSRAQTRSLQFVSDWLNLDRLENMSPNRDRYPQWTTDLGRDMKAETLEFFEEVVWRQDRPLRDLFDAKFTFATPQLAQHYGLKPQGDGLRKYDLTHVNSRGGLLTQGSVLTIGGDDASMVTRGLFVMRDLLRGVIGAPPPGVDTTPVPAEPGITLRNIAEQRIRNDACGGCHQKFEPLAFGLEQFDGLGSYHLKDEFGNELRADGQLLIPGESQPVVYKDSAELMKLLAASERVQETLTWKLTQFCLGRPLGAADAIEVQRLHRTAQDAGGRYADVITEIVMSELVQNSRGEVSQ